MKFSYSRLRGKLAELNISQEALARYVHISPATLNYKLNGKVQFKQSEMVSILDYIGEPLCKIVEYFFCLAT